MKKKIKDVYEVQDRIEYYYKGVLQYGKVAKVKNEVYHVSHRNIETDKLIDSSFYVIDKSNIVCCHCEDEDLPPASIIKKLRGELKKKKIRKVKVKKKAFDSDDFTWSSMGEVDYDYMTMPPAYKKASIKKKIRKK